jgi:hypothetical protein
VGDAAINDPGPVRVGRAAAALLAAAAFVAGPSIHDAVGIGAVPTESRDEASVRRNELMNAWASLEVGGVPCEEAHWLAHLLTTGAPPPLPEGADALPPAECAYVRVDVFFHGEDTVMSAPMAVRPDCLAAFVPLAGGDPCPDGTRVMWRFVTDALCDGDLPSRSCAWLVVRGAFCSSDPGVCASIHGCECLGLLKDAVRECAPWSPVSDLPMHLTPCGVGQLRPLASPQ